MIYQTSLSDNDPLGRFAGIISGIYIFFCNYICKIFDLYTVWYQITAETKCYTVSVECQHSKNTFHSTLISRECCTTQKHSLSRANYFCCCESSYFIRRYVCDLFLDLKPKSLITECILVGFETHNSEMYNYNIDNTQYTNKAIEPCLPLKYLVYPKRSFHVGDSFPRPSFY